MACYKNRSPAPHVDLLLKYNSCMGEGKSDLWRIDNDGCMIRKSPFAPKEEVNQIAARHQQSQNPQQDSGRTPRQRVDMSVVREESAMRQVEIDKDRARKKAARAEQRRIREDEERTPEQWNAKLSQKDLENKMQESEINMQSGRIKSLQDQVKMLQDQLLEAKAIHAEDLQKADAKRSADMLRFAAENNQLLESTKRAKIDHSKSLEKAESDLSKSLQNDISGAGWEKVRRLFSKFGGLSRLTLFNDDWHAEHKEAAKRIWGYPSWKETKHYVEAYFPQSVYNVDTSYDPSKFCTFDKGGDVVLPTMTEFEQCLLARMFFRTFTEQEIVALIVDKSRRRIGQILEVWGPRWGNVGDDMCCIDITRDYIFKEVSDLNIHLGRPRLVNVDGKDAHIAQKRNDTTISKATFSSKNDDDCTRWLAFSTAGGLTFEKTPPVAARAGERALVRWWGSLGPENAPVQEWEDVAKNEPWKATDDVFWTALTDVLSAAEFDDMMKRIEDGDPLFDNGALDDGVLLTAQPTSLAREGLQNEDSGDDEPDEPSPPEDSEATNVEPTPEQTAAIESARRVFDVSAAWTMYNDMVQMKSVEKALRDSGDKKRPPVFTPQILEEQANKALRSGPNSSGKRKLCQLERHQRLHLLYEGGQLSKCLFSYFLLVEEPNRLKMLSWMGSELAASVPKPNLEDVPRIPLRLAKIPEDCSLGGDKGFTGIEKSLPNINHVDTPVQVQNSKTHRLSSEQIESDIPITTVRAPCETIFSRTGNEAILSEKIPYWLIRYLPMGQSLAHGEANIRAPLRYPGRNSIVGQDYWENVREYTRIPQPTVGDLNVETSSRRECRKCGNGGIVRMCATCKKWYHPQDACHDFVHCNVGPVVNPYH
mmetsp:Transcript_44335/g.94357  ORF Transcript_44335/g.94357 Transcript_44335/m.94357 type:complete len:877 (+) Transcript_44335:1360-3990(+)